MKTLLHAEGEGEPMSNLNSLASDLLTSMTSTPKMVSRALHLTKLSLQKSNKDNVINHMVKMDGNDAKRLPKRG